MIVKKIPVEEWEQCQNCPNQGFTVEERGGVQYVTRDMALDACDLSIEGMPIDDRYQEQVQCQFCYTNEKSVFNQENNTAEIILLEKLKRHCRKRSV